MNTAADVSLSVRACKRNANKPLETEEIAARAKDLMCFAFALHIALRFDEKIERSMRAA